MGSRNPGRKTMYLTLLLTLLMHTGTPSDREQAGIPVTIDTINGPIEAECPQMTGDQPVISIAGSPYPVRDLLSIRFRNGEEQSGTTDQIRLIDGTRWMGRMKITDIRGEDHLTWVTPSLPSSLQIPLEEVLEYRESRSPREPFPAPDPDSDQLLTSDGALLTGVLENLVAEGIRFDDPSLGDLTIPWSKVIAFRLAEIPSDSAPRAGTELPVRVVTSDRSVILGQLQKIDEVSILLTRQDGQQLAFPLNRIQQVTIELGRVVPLGHRSPSMVEEGLPGKGWFPWNWKIDQNVLGKPLQIGSRIYSNGIGVHSRCHLTYSIEEGDRFLTGIAGMDISSRPPDDEKEIGCARFSISVDGETVFVKESISWKDPGVQFRIPLEKAQTFTLKVDLGPGHHILDRANWAEIRILKD